VSKKLIIITGAAGLVSFAGAFVIGWLTRPGPAAQSGEPNQTAVAGGESQLKPMQSVAGTVGNGAAKTVLTEKQLQDFVIEVREKMREYNNRLQSLETREQRLKMAQDVLKKDTENLNNLRVEVAAMIAGLKEERDKLQKSRLEIVQAEKANLTSVAATYDKMEASSASKILISMCTSGEPKKQIGGAGRWEIGFDDAVKILHYMSERTKAKVLAELVDFQPKLAAALCERLKQITEGK